MSVVLVTGATGHVGGAVARTLFARGEGVVLVERGTDRLPSTFPEMIGSARALFVGGIDLPELGRAVSAGREAMGGIDALVHAVGGWEGGSPISDADPAAYARMFERNLLSAVHACRAALPALRESAHGRIVLFGSVDALAGRAGSAAYAASKGGLLRFAESLSEELRGTRVGVCTLLPTSIDAIGVDAVAEVVAFLVSPASAAIRASSIVLGTP